MSWEPTNFAWQRALTECAPSLVSLRDLMAADEVALVVGAVLTDELVVELDGDVRAQLAQVAAHGDRVARLDGCAGSTLKRALRMTILNEPSP